MNQRMMNWRNKEPRRTGAEGYSIAKDTENTSVSEHNGQLEDIPARFMHQPISTYGLSPKVS